METLESKLALIGRHAERAVAALRSDRGASPVLLAVVEEMDRKARKANSGIAAADAAGKRELIVEVEQAADSALAGAKADQGLGEEARHLVEIAHQAFCVFKHETK